MKAPRWLRLTGRIALGLVASLVLVIGGGLVFLQTASGGEALRKFLVPKVNQQIAGRLELGSLRLHGARLELGGVRLYTSQNELVAALGHLDVAVRLLPLLHRRVVVEHLFLDDPAVHLASDRRGLNLSRAVAPRQPKPPEPEKPPSHSTMAFELRQLRLRGGLVELRGPIPVRVDELTIDGHAALAGATVDADLRLAAESRVPVGAPLALGATVKGDGDTLTGRVSLDFGDTALRASLTGKGDLATVKLEELTVDPALVRAFAPDAPGPVKTLRLTGEGRRSGKAVAANLTLAAGEGRIRVEVEALPEEYHLRHLKVSGQNVDLSALLRAGPPSSLAFGIEGHAAGKDLQSAQGQVKIDLPPSRLGPYRVGPIFAEVGAEHGGVKLTNLVAELPGLSVRAHGSGSARALNLDAEVAATDLAALGRALRPAGARRGGPDLGGSGKLTVGVRGTPRAPQVEARGNFAALRFGANAVRGLDLRLTANSFLQPAKARIDLTLAAREVQAAGRTWSEVKATVGAAERRVTTSVGVGKPALSLDAQALLDRDAQGFTLEALALGYPEARWRLTRPAKVGFGDSFTLDDLDLSAGEQRIAATLALRPRQLKARVNIARLDLGRLPRAFVPPSLDLAGLLNVDADVSGPPARPQGKARVSLHGGRFRKLDHIELDLTASHDGRRLRGDLEARVPQTQAMARFDLPAVWPAPERSPVNLQVAVSPFDIPALVAAAGQSLPLEVKGRGSLEAHITGTAGRPGGALLAVAKGLSVRGQDLGDTSLAVTLESPGAETRLSTDLATCGGKLTVRAAAPVAIVKVPRLSATALLHTPVTATVKVERLPLRPLAKVARVDVINGGLVNASLNGHGTARAPAGTLELTIADLTGKHLPATDLDLTASSDEEGNRASIKVRRQGEILAQLEAALKLAATRLEDQEALAAAALSVRAHVGPLELSRRDLPQLTPNTPEQRLTGVVDADLKVDGSLHAPRVALLVDGRNFRLGQQALGDAELAVRYASARPELNLKVSTSNKGWLTVKGTAPLDLSYPRVTRGLDLNDLPLTVDLHAEGVDLAGFSGLAEPVRTVAGQLLADVKVRGKVSAPTVDGKVEWRNGQLTLTGYGIYDRVHVQAHGNLDQWVLDDLSARTGAAGQAKVSAQGTRNGTAYQVASTIALNKFPIYTDGQELAGVTLKTKMAGTASAQRVDLKTNIDEARVALAPARPKRLQSLKRPDDVVLLSDGEPLDAEQARKLRTLQAAFEAARSPTPTARRRADRPLRVRLEVEAPRNIWIDGPDMHLELGLESGFLVVIANGAPRIFGTVDVRRGRVEVLGKRFDLDPSSTVRFTGPSDVPVLAVKASYEARSVGITIQVNVDGPANAISLKLSSPTNPEYGDTDLLTILATGHAPGDPGGGSPNATQEAASLLGGVLASQLQKTLTKHLPLDVLVIEPGQGVSTSRIEAGTYLTSDVYVAYVGRFGADAFTRENTHEVHLEYQLSRRWSFQASYGDARKGSADLVWTKSY